MTTPGVLVTAQNLAWLGPSQSTYPGVWKNSSSDDILMTNPSFRPMAGLLIILTLLPTLGIGLMRCGQDWMSVLALAYGSVAIVQFGYLGWIFLSSTHYETPRISTSTGGS